MCLNDLRVNRTLGQYHRLHATSACGSEPTNSYFTSSISLGRHFLVKNDSFCLWRPEISYTLSAWTGTPSQFAAAARSVNNETCSGEWSVNMACNFA